MMLRVVKVFLVLSFFLISIPCFADVDQYSEANWACDPEYNHDGEIELVAETLSEEPDHLAICVYRNRQNSILLRTNAYKFISVSWSPLEGAPANPFYVPIEHLNSISEGKLVSSGPPRRDLPDNKVFKYKMTIKLYDQNKKVAKTIDPHTPVHTKP